ncbi:hypothetical protein PMAYCL1PPCAC_30721 [Pristionchus mayeri]|uniref:Uncharacterized protein n=1 Tax=Pristionchus mayeri TaxID=1317129 RepID=A0AAN5IF63_9BILA|nr:hypothetical protein PMAYCL1PPCAC_30721 [Pristionchus mayeri]
METLTKISSRVTDLTKKSKGKRLEDDTFLPHSFIPPTFSSFEEPSAVSSPFSFSSPTIQARSTLQIPNSIRRFSPFPRKQSSAENKETTKVETSMQKEQKESKYRKIGEDGEVEKSNGVRRLKDSAMDRVDRMKKNRQGEYGVQLLDDEQD